MRIRRTVAAGFGVPAVAIAYMIAIANPAAASDGPGWSNGHHVLLMTYGSNLCLTATARNRKATVEHCNGSKAQTWTVRAHTTVRLAETFTAYQFVNGLGMCLRPTGSSNASGTAVGGASCFAASRHHREVWIPLLAYTDSPTARWTLANGQSGLFLVAHNDDRVGSGVYEYNTNHAPSGFGYVFAGY